MQVNADIPVDKYDTPLVDLDKTVWTAKPVEPEFETKTAVGGWLDLHELVDSNPTDDEENIVYPSEVIISAVYTDEDYIGIAEPITITIN